MGGAAIASAQTTNDAPTPNVTAPTPPARHHARRRGHHALFRGVKLTTEQRAQLKTIRGQMRTEAKPIVQQLRSERQALRTARKGNDSTAVSAARGRMAETRKAMQDLRDKYLSQERGVLTPEQQAQFDKNVSAIKAHWEQRRSERKAS
jgi:protein CpxP